MTKEECEVETSKAIMEMRNHIEEFEKELEKEADNFCDKVNKRLLSTNYGVSPYSNRVSILDVQEAYIAGAEPREKRIAELEEENTELKERNGKLAGQNASLNRWLGEAITFIKDYMIITIGDHTTVCSVPEENRCINVLKLNERAKSFLKEFE